MLRAILFDLDGVITDSAQYHYLAWKQLADRLDIPFDLEFNEQLKGVSRMASLELILNRGNCSHKLTEAEKARLAHEKNENYKQLIEKITPADILPGIHELLEAAAEMGVKSVITSASKNAEFIIQRLGLMKRFWHIVDAEFIERAKPYPDVFIAGAYAAGCKASECVGIEDAAAGIEAIQAAGMKAVGVGSEHMMKKADLILENTQQLTLERIMGLVS